jgi:hypothetical protein
MQLFIICHQISKEYPALNPHELEAWSFGDVIRLYSDMRAFQIAEKKATATESENVIRKPATTWF